MAAIDMEELKKISTGPISIAILDQEGEKAPFVQKEVKKIELCPDGTHVRIYFDNFYFLAIPLGSTVTVTDHSWSAYDEEAKLHYVMKWESDQND